MKFKAVFVFCVCLLAAVPTLAQRSRTVTNNDLEKYKQQRLKAERDYIDNYARLGFPSPEELQKQIEKNRIEREALVARLAAERQQREEMEALRQEAARQGEQNIYFYSNGGSGRGYYGYPGGYYYGRGFPGVRQYAPPVNAGNGIPLVNFYGYPAVQRARPAISVPRRR